MTLYGIMHKDGKLQQEYKHLRVDTKGVATLERGPCVWQSKREARDKAQSRSDVIVQVQIVPADGHFNKNRVHRD